MLLMKSRHLLALLLLLLPTAACQQARVTPPVAVAEPTPSPQPTKEQIAERHAHRKKVEAARLVKVRRQAEDALERGRERLREEQNTEAMAAFQESVRLNRDSVNAWIRIAYVYEQEGDTVRAQEAFREVKKLWAM